MITFPLNAAFWQTALASRREAREPHGLEIGYSRPSGTASAGGADDQLDREDNFGGCEAGFIAGRDSLKEERGCPLGDLNRGLGDGGERRRDNVGEFKIVKPNQRNVLG